MKLEEGKTWGDMVGKKFYMDALILAGGVRSRAGDVRITAVFLKNTVPDKTIIKKIFKIACEKREAEKLALKMVPSPVDRLVLFWETEPRLTTIISATMGERLMSPMWKAPVKSEFNYQAGDAPKDAIKREIQKAPVQKEGA